MAVHGRPLLVHLLFVLLVGAYARNLAAEDKCSGIAPFLEYTGSFAAADPPGPVCSGSCCSATTETSLRSRARSRLSSLVKYSSKPLQALLSSARDTLHGHVQLLARQSENKTLYLFSQVYRRMSIFSREPIAALYRDILDYIRLNSTDLSTQPDLNIQDSVTEFFTDLFPLSYHHAVNLQHSDFHPEYKTCLRQAFSEIQPFGDIPRQISNSVYKTLEATRVLLQALTLGTEILNATDDLLANGEDHHDSCHTALLKMSYCPKCLGLDPNLKPCSGYCLNVLRGCLTHHVSELDSPWNDYVEAIERIIFAMKSHDSTNAVNVDLVVRDLAMKISEAIMYAMENGPGLEKKVNRACGRARLGSSSSGEQLSEGSGGYHGISNEDSASAPAPTAPPARIAPPDTETMQFLASLARSKGFFGGLADALCHDDAFAEQRDNAVCWNGDRVGEYTKTVVGSGMSYQKYNPEVTVSTVHSNDGRVGRLADKLRHVRQLLVSQMTLTAYPSSESFMQSDDAGLEGSGSGRGGAVQWSDDADDQGWGSDGSGSGDGYDDTHTRGSFVPSESDGHPSVVQVEKAGSSAPQTTTPLLWCHLSTLVAILTLRRHRIV